MNNIDISVIVTVHNAENYLSQALDSVVNQTYRNIEIICIDGGSSDASPEILKEYALRDSRIRIINDTNTSYGHKINRGMDEARGEYIAVLESDDSFEKDMLEKLWKIVELYHPDMVNGNYYECWDIGNHTVKRKHVLYHEQPYEQLIDNSAHSDQMEIMDRYWTGLYKRSFLEKNDIRLNESPGASFQDMSFRFLLSVLAETSYHISDFVYNYRMDNPYSSMKDQSKTVVIVDEHDYLENELKKRDIDDENIWFLKYFWKYVDFDGNLTHLQAASRPMLVERYREELEKDLPKMPQISGRQYFHTEDWILSDSEKHVKYLEESFQNFKKVDEHFLEFVENTICSDKALILFGCGRRAEYALNRLDDICSRDSITCFSDNSIEKRDSEFMGYRVYAPEDTLKKYPDAKYLITSIKYGEEITEGLIEKGISKENIVLFDI